MNVPDRERSNDTREHDIEESKDRLNQINKGWRVTYDFQRDCYVLDKWYNGKYHAVLIPREFNYHIERDDSDEQSDTANGSGSPNVQGDESVNLPNGREARRDDGYQLNGPTTYDARGNRQRGTYR